MEMRHIQGTPTKALVSNRNAPNMFSTFHCPFSGTKFALKN